MKTCSKCDELLSKTLFYKEKRSKDGLRSMCKKCVIAGQKKYKDNNKDKIKEQRLKSSDKQKKYMKEWRKRNSDHIKEYNNEWRENNVEHVKQYTKDYYDNNRDIINEKTRLYRKNNPDKVRASDLEYRIKNKESIDIRRENNREYYIQYARDNKEILKPKKAEYYRLNKERFSVRNREYRLNNKEKKQAYDKEYGRVNIVKKVANANKRRAMKLNATPKWSELDKIQVLYEKAKWLESLTGLKYHVDHIIPLKGENVCGLHVWENLQLLEASINISKGNRV